MKCQVTLFKLTSCRVVLDGDNKMIVEKIPEGLVGAFEIRENSPFFDMNWLLIILHDFFSIHI